MTLPARLLVLHLGSIGELVDALPFAAAVEDERPDVHLGWVSEPVVEALLAGHPCLERVHLWRRGGGLGELTRLVRELRAERYELAVDLSPSRKSALLARLAGLPRVTGGGRRRTREAGWSWSEGRIATGHGDVHRAEGYLELATQLGCPASAPRHVLPRDAAAEAWAEERVRALGGAPVLVHLGASKPENRWDPERFGALARALADAKAFPVCLTGGPADRVRVVAGMAMSPDVHDLVGALSLAQFVALARRSRLFVGGETGPMHVAAAVGTPVVALFGPAEPARVRPWGEGHRVLRGRSMRMEDIEVEEALACVQRHLGLERALR